MQLAFNQIIEDKHLPELKRYLNSKLPNQNGVLDIEIVQKQTIMNYMGEKTQTFLKVYTLLPKYVN